MIDSDRFLLPEWMFAFRGWRLIIANGESADISRLRLLLHQFSIGY